MTSIPVSDLIEQRHLPDDAPIPIRVTTAGSTLHDLTQAASAAVAAHVHAERTRLLCEIHRASPGELSAAEKARDRAMCALEALLNDQDRE